MRPDPNKEVCATCKYGRKLEDWTIECHCPHCSNFDRVFDYGDSCNNHEFSDKDEDDD